MTEPATSNVDDTEPPTSATRLLRPDSPVVTTAQELFMAHARQDGETCSRCGRPSPCPVATHAQQVCEAAGVPPRPVTSSHKRKSTKATKKPNVLANAA
ncbi:hypothetical protein [Allorhizocola rhizosphaerae]|uniref:hypothetical protein n=1 Tax=Allorhizocola rhizosphaerae TaxID=1872709 RepID=UPI0013C2FAC9|nr:hypothetical protein [Allorhizocola rhizosphaerae]